MKITENSLTTDTTHTDTPKKPLASKRDRSERFLARCGLQPRLTGPTTSPALLLLILLAATPLVLARGGFAASPPERLVTRPEHEIKIDGVTGAFITQRTAYGQLNNFAFSLNYGRLLNDAGSLELTGSLQTSYAGYTDSSSGTQATTTSYSRFLGLSVGVLWNLVSEQKSWTDAFFLGGAVGLRGYLSNQPSASSDSNDHSLIVELTFGKRLQLLSFLSWTPSFTLTLLANHELPSLSGSLTPLSVSLLF